MKDEKNRHSSDESQNGGQSADPVPDPVAHANTMGMAIVRCSGASYGIDVKWVREIRQFSDATPVPGMATFWVGITALRGDLYAVLDLHQFLFPQHDPVESPQQIVFTAVNDLSIGLLVDEIQAVLQLDEPATYGDQITVLDLPGLFADPRITEP